MASSPLSVAPPGPLLEKPMRTTLSLSAILLLPLALSSSAAAQTLGTVRVASGLSSPLYAGAPAGDFDRLFIVEQSTARIKILNLSSGSINGTPFLDIGSIASSGGERGLLGLAFHPSYASNGLFYVNYTDNGGDTVISQYSVSSNPDIASSGSAVVIFGPQNQPYSNHNGGCIQFGPDGMLYCGMGDGGSGNDPGNRAQNLGRYMGKMLRFDVDAGPPYIPSDNPFLSNGSAHDEIWAYGLRNPWRFSFDRDTGDMYIADVGQNAYEEIDFQAASSSGGENYGWRCMEGDNCTGLSGCTCSSSSLTDPIKTYSHSLGCSVTGGYVYRGADIPGLGGTYFYADYCSGRIWSFRYVGGAVTEFTTRTSELTPDVGSIGLITSFGEDAAGEMYIVDGGGEVFKLVCTSDCGPTCGTTNYCTAASNSVSASGAIVGMNGSFSVAANDQLLYAYACPPNQFGIFYYGPSQTQVAFGNGHRCVAGSMYRFAPQQVSIWGDVTLALDLTAPPQASGTITAGSTWNFQFWYRDPPGVNATFNLTNALNVEFCP